MAKDYSDWIGRRFGRWTVVGFGLRRVGTQNHMHMSCRCECGHGAWILKGNLEKGYSTRCKACADRRHAVMTQASKGNTVVGWENGNIRVACKCGNAMSTRAEMCDSCRSRFGHGKYPESLRAVATRVGVCKERVRQVIDKKGWDGMLAYFSKPRTLTGRSRGPRYTHQPKIVVLCTSSGD